MAVSIIIGCETRLIIQHTCTVLHEPCFCFSDIKIINIDCFFFFPYSNGHLQYNTIREVEIRHIIQTISLNNSVTPWTNHKSNCCLPFSVMNLSSKITQKWCLYSQQVSGQLSLAAACGTLQNLWCSKWGPMASLIGRDSD